MNIRYNDKKDIYYFLILFIFTVISVYYFPPFLNKYFFLLILIPVWLSKKNYFWITFFIIIVSSPMRLFEDYGGLVIHRIPQYDIIGKYGPNFNEIFLIFLLIKAIVKGRKNRLLLNNNYLILLILIIFLYIISFFYGFTGVTLISYSRGLLYFTLFYSVPRLLRNEDIIFTFKVFSVFTILTFANQILSATIGFNIADKIAGKTWVESFFEESKYIRAYDSVLAQFFTFNFGLVMYSMRKPMIKKNYLFFIIIISYLSIFMTGSRGWIISFSIVLIFYILLVERKKSKVIANSTLFLVLFLFFISYIPSLQVLFHSNIERISTMEELAKGDITAGGTMVRLSERLPRLLEGTKQNPILGWGFSDTFDYYRDGHVGWVNQILQMGIIGLLLFITFWFSFCKFNLNLSKKLAPQNPFKVSLKTINLGLLSLLIIHSTSRTMFNISMIPSILILTIFYFIFSDMWAKMAIHANKYILNNG